MLWAYKKLLSNILRGAIHTGRLTIVWPDGAASTFGNGDTPTATVSIRDTRTVRKILQNPALTVGEAFTDETLIPLNGTIHDLLTLLLTNIGKSWHKIPILRLNNAIRQLQRPFHRPNSAPRSRRNIAHHYDLSSRLYSLFLDRDRQYSCAYFPIGNETLEEAQLAKKRHIAAKLLLNRPGLKILDIGSGWGGLALTLARDYGAEVTGITLSEAQLHESRARAAAENLSSRVTFELQDYRAITQKFDRIVSVGMLEHVGTPNYAAYFATIRRCLTDDGIALIHAIGRFAGPAITNPWIAKYIFPGGYSPALSEVLPHIEKSGLLTTDIEILRLHYAKTLTHWRRRFTANRDAISTLYDERFCRMFEFYLSASELAFRQANHMNFQLQLTPTQRSAPLTRDYMLEAEQHYRQPQHAQ